MGSLVVGDSAPLPEILHREVVGGINVSGLRSCCLNCKVLTGAEVTVLHTTVNLLAKAGAVEGHECSSETSLSSHPSSAPYGQVALIL